MKIDDVFRPQFKPNPALLKPANIGLAFRAVIGTIQPIDANRIWGKSFITATAFTSVQAQRDFIIGGRSHPTRLAKLKIELTLRHSGRILGRISYTFKQDGKEVQHQWKDLGHLDPFNGISASTLQQTWQENGYTITRQQPSAQMQAEIAMAMIANLA